MFAKDIIQKIGTWVSPGVLALFVIIFIVESIYGAYRMLKFYNEYIKSKYKKR